MNNMYLVLEVIVVALVLLAVLHLIKRTERIPMDARTRKSAPGQFVGLSDGVTHYELKGPEDGKIVVLIPGATLPTWVWNYLDMKLAESGYRVLSYDLLGRGFSDRPYRRYNLDLHRKQLRELLDELVPTQKVHMVSLAFGTLIAADFIMHYPKRVKSLTAMGPDGFGVVMSKQVSSRLMQIPFIRNYLFSIIGTKALMERIPSYSTSRKVVKEIEKLYRPTLNWKGFKRSVLSSIRHMPIHDATTLYRGAEATGVPIKLIWGERDEVTPYPGDKQVRSVFPNADLVKLPGGGHLPHFESAEPVTEEITSFLSANELD